MNPKISIIIPVYNTEKYLNACLESIKEQTFDDFEAIIVDDGSTDSSYETAKKFSDTDKRFKVFRTENGGVSKARNYALEKACGKYATFVDSDDELYKTALETLYRAAEENDADISAGTVTVVKKSAVETGANDKAVTAWDKKQAIEEALKDNCTATDCRAKLYRKDRIEGVKFAEGRKIHEDSFFIFECILKCDKIILKNENVYKYMLRDNSSSRSAFSEKYFDILYFAEKKREIINEKFPEFSAQTKNLMLKANMAMIEKLMLDGGEKYGDDIKKCRNEVKKHKKDYIPANRRDKINFYLILHAFPLYKYLKRKNMAK